MRIKKRFWIIAPLLIFSALVYTSCQPLREFGSVPVYNSKFSQKIRPVVYDKSKKTIVIMAHHKGTEIFDLMAPYYLFNATEKANVYVVAEKKTPIVLLKGLFIYPDITFEELDSLKIKPDVVVIPAMVEVFMQPQSTIVTWVKQQNSDTKILSVCAGSLVGAATGLYDGKPITTHASQLEESKEFFKNPLWVQNVSVTQSGNLYGTAGVSNAVEGSLTIIKEMFGKETAEKVMADINYPHAEIKMEHNSLAVKTGNKFTIANKLLFKKNRKVAVLLQDGMNEFTLAAVLDAYHRTFPSRLETVMVNGHTVTSKYGLTIMPTGSLSELETNEIHVLAPENLSDSDLKAFENTSLVRYNPDSKQYIFNECLERIKVQYGPKFENITKLLLDYN